MAVEECPHCIRNVIFSEGGKCPACGQSKYVSPNKSREHIIYDQEKEDTEEKIKYLAKRGPRLIVGGVILTVLIVGVIILLIYYGTFVIYWTGGLLVGISMIGRGFADFRDKRELIYFFEKKYNMKLPG